jgi:hypothetical protein
MVGLTDRFRGGLFGKTTRICTGLTNAPQFADKRDITFRGGQTPWLRDAAAKPSNDSLSN